MPILLFMPNATFIRITRGLFLFINVIRVNNLGDEIKLKYFSFYI